MKKPDDINRIRHMHDSALDACEFLGDLSFEDFRTNRQLALAIMRALEIVGEAASQISQHYRDEHEEIEWRTIIGMRNRLVHAYFDIDYLIVWETVQNDLPPLINNLKRVLEEEG